MPGVYCGADRRGLPQEYAADGGARRVSYDWLHHFIASGVWDEEGLEAALLAEADRQGGGDDSWLIINDMTLTMVKQSGEVISIPYTSGYESGLR